MRKRLSKRSNPEISIIVPLYNEQRRIKNLPKIYYYLRGSKISFEIIAVNDGSIDNTLEKLYEYRKKIKFQLITYPVNKGKGFAIRKGMLSSYGRHCLFIDVDLSTPIEELTKFLVYLKKNDLVIGSRKMRGSKVEIRQNFIRENLGKGFTYLSQLILNLDVSDMTCGFKCFSRRSAQEIFKRQKIDRWGFDSEVLFIAKKLGFNIKEVPVNWSNDPNTKVKFPHAIIYSLLDLLKIKYYDSKNFYR